MKSAIPAANSVFPALNLQVSHFYDQIAFCVSFENLTKCRLFPWGQDERLSVPLIDRVFEHSFEEIAGSILIH
jgi:hypothetical protein